MKNSAIKFNEFYLPLVCADAAKVANTGLHVIGSDAKAMNRNYITAYSSKNDAWAQAWHHQQKSNSHSAVVLSFVVSDTLHWIIGLEPGSQISLAKEEDPRVYFSEGAWSWIAHGSRVISPAPFSIEFNSYSMNRANQAASTLFLPLSARQAVQTVMQGLTSFYQSPTENDPFFVKVYTDEAKAKSEAILIADSVEGGACPTHLEVEIGRTALAAYGARSIGVPIVDPRRDKELLIAGNDWLLLSQGAPGCPPARYTINCAVSALGKFRNHEAA